MIVLGLTGSIGTGKSTTAAMFRNLGVPVHDADATVHDLYRGEAVAPVAARFPEALADGAIDRKALSAALARAPERFGELEAIIHPLVRAREIAFVKAERQKGSPLVLLDIPLLYEAGGESRVDKVAVVTCDPQTQRRRVLERPGMTEEKFALILSRQMPDAEKRQRADFVIDTGRGLEAARKQVEEIIAKLTERRN
ncbi:dephospho-CoA kinase [Shinella zoogloeoides]|uniref:Dephospho-CoA kinase n=1 Tax=Shinella zoogloeoides TaxID=352475 RepID=A0A6N8TCU1_SHIZO|nr:dephospho-CoA kinase [Shinella zoogloeoides]MXO00769.1 dephospho-CoA kinase [Shinella zoogloeoides]UEX81312.1 dephospho-CoA kinase [Shinella zoogloeoides]